MSSQLSDAEWDHLLAQIERGGCTPFVGAGVNVGRQPLPSDLAMRWAEEGKYPLEDPWNLARVSQFMALEKGARWPRDEITKVLSDSTAPDPDAGPDALQLLAELPFRNYITTGYDDLLAGALRAATVSRGGKRVARRPRVDFCRWHAALRSSSLPTPFDEDPHYVPSAEEPFLFHVYGQAGVAESLVLTEDDHFDLLVNTARHPTVLPPPVQRALRGGPLLFIGHPLADWNFRVVLRSLCGADFRGLQAGTLSVHVKPEGDDAVIRFLEKSFAKTHIKLYWGTPHDFLLELRERWTAAQSR